MRKRATKCVSIPQRPDCTGLVFSGFFSLLQPRRSQKQGQWLEKEEVRAGVQMEAALINRAQRRPCLGSWAQPILDKLKASITSVPHDEDAHLRPGGPSSHHWSSGPGIQVSPTLVLCSWWGFRGGTHRLPCLFSWAASAQEVPALGGGLGKISLPFEGEAGRGMRNSGDSVDGSRLGQTLSGAACGGFVQTSR